MNAPTPAAPGALDGLRTLVLTGSHTGSDTGDRPDLAALLADPTVGALAVDDTALPALPGLPGLPADAPLVVVMTGGAAQLEGPLRLAARDGLRVVGVRATLRDAADPAGNVRRVTAAVDAVRDAGLLDASVPVTLVLPADVAPSAAQAALDELSYADLTAGVVGEDPHAWAALVDAALDREVPVETLGGRWDPVAVLAATRACLDGDPAVGVLEGSAEAALSAYDEATLARTRRWCPRVDVRL